MGQNSSKGSGFGSSASLTGGSGRVGEIGACLHPPFPLSLCLTTASPGAPSLVGAISSEGAGTTVRKQPPRVFKPVLKGRVGAHVIATLIEAVSEIDATVRARAILSVPPPPSPFFSDVACGSCWPPPSTSSSNISATSYARARACACICDAAALIRSTFSGRCTA